MADGRALFYLSFLIVILHVNSDTYQIPDVLIEVFKPKGIRASIPGSDAFTVSYFVFDARIKRANAKDGTESNEKIYGSAILPTRPSTYSSPLDGPWIVVDENVTLNVGDQLDYEISVTTIQSPQYHKKYGKYIVTELINGGVKPPDPPWANLFKEDKATTELYPEDPIVEEPTTKRGCRPTLTKVRNAAVCAGEVILEDHFDNLNEDLWQIEHYIPTKHPEHPFVSYQKLLNQTVAVKDGQLWIEPRLLETIPPYSNESLQYMAMDLYNGCTKSEEECYMQASGASILPPVVSGRLTSRVAFTYGTVQIRARLPQGDWIYPEILLEPFLKRYGSLHYASGLLKIASALGNRQLSSFDGYELGNSLLEGGAVLSMDCRKALIFSKKHAFHSRVWGDGFHVFKLRWTPDIIALSIDGAEWARIDISGEDRIQDQIPTACSNSTGRLLGGTKMAPFDTHFYLALGVAAGGVGEFPDGSTSAGAPKPWRNAARKAVLDFWRSRDTWHSTWTQPRLMVDYVKIKAL